MRLIISHFLPHEWQRFCRSYPDFCLMVDNVRRSIFQYDPETLEAQKGIMAVATGLWVIWAGYWPHEAFSSPVYQLLMRFLPDWLWCGIFVSVGLAQITAMNWSKVCWRAASAMLSFILWSFIAALLALDTTPGPGIVVFPILALSDAWVYLRLTLHGDTSRVENAEHAVSN